jgi:EAL domain-containing protein (putative c-di-GMP-specific phosphodiesterase class I)
MKLSDLHIRQHDDGSYTAIWGPFLLKSGFQPIFKMAGGPARIGAFEALCRPFRDGLASSPGKFFPLVPAEEGFQVELQTRAVHVLNAPSVLVGSEWLFLNFDPSMFRSKNSIEEALTILDETLEIAGLSRRRIVCEVTEHRTEEAHLLWLVGAMRDRGFKIAVDDYGADDSDMERVRKLSPDIIKFDAYWITKMMDSGHAGADLLKNMVHTFRDRGIITLFEGIEHGWQLDLAVECSVDFVQGYVLAKPQTVPADFHDFRAKMGSVSPVEKPKPPVVTRSSLDIWDRNMAEVMETPQPMAVPSRQTVSQTPSLTTPPAAPPLPNPGPAVRRPAPVFGKRH